MTNRWAGADCQPTTHRQLHSSCDIGTGRGHGATECAGVERRRDAQLRALTVRASSRNGRTKLTGPQRVHTQSTLPQPDTPNDEAEGTYQRKDLAMGFFSQDCTSCGHPLLCAAATDPINRWMTHGVAIDARGNVVTGEYDGYGALDGHEEAVGGEATVWHRDCWDKAGQPTAYQGVSEGSADQGWFFDDGEHAMQSPLL